MKTLTIKSLITTLSFLALLLKTTFSLAVVPHLLPVHGTLLDNNGKPFTGAVPMVFTIYDHDANALWMENRTFDDAVKIENGYFSVYLGEITKLSPKITWDDDTKLYLTIHAKGLEVARVPLNKSLMAVEARRAAALGTFGPVEIQPVIENSCDEGERLDGWNASTNKPKCRPFPPVAVSGKKNSLRYLPDYLEDHHFVRADYAAGDGLTIEDYVLNLVEADIKGALRGVCFDKAQELLDVLDYSALDHRHDIITVENIPKGFIDLKDDDTTYLGAAGIAINEGATVRRQGSQYQRTIVVDAGGGGDFTEIQSAVDSASSASENNPVLIFISPGTYTGKVVTRPHVHLKGAGAGLTLITSSAFNDTGLLDEATLVLVENVSVRDVTIENTGCGETNIALLSASLNRGTSRVIDSVVQSLGECTDNRAIYLGAEFLGIELRSVTAQSNHTGLYIETPATVTVQGGRYHGDMVGIHNNLGHDVSCNNVEVQASSKTGRLAVLNNGGTIRLFGNTLVSGNIQNDYSNARLTAVGIQIKGEFENGFFSGKARAVLNGVSLSGRFANYGVLLANDVKGEILECDHGGQTTINGGSFTDIGLYGLEIDFEMNFATITSDLFLGAGDLAVASISNTNVNGAITVSTYPFQPEDYGPGTISIAHTQMSESARLDEVSCAGVIRGLDFYAETCPL